MFTRDLQVQGSGNPSTINIGRLAFASVLFGFVIVGNLLYFENLTYGRHPSTLN